MHDTAITIRPATPADLPAINHVIEAAVMTWDLPERVKRLSLPSYRYNALDLQHLDLVVAETSTGVVGVAGWEAAADRDCPAGKHGLLLHGLYVAPADQHKGVGSALLDAAVKAARHAGVDGVLVKAQADAVGFFLRQGLVTLPVADPGRHYPNRLWKEVTRGYS